MNLWLLLAAINGFLAVAAGAFAPLLVAAIEIFRWSTRSPSCAISADSMFRTTCFGAVSPVTSTWIASTDPLSVDVIRTLTTSCSDAMSSSARWSGSTEPAIGDPGVPGTWGWGFVTLPGVGRNGRSDAGKVLST